MMKTGAHVASCFELKKAPIQMLWWSEKRKLYACMRVKLRNNVSGIEILP